MLFKAIFKRCLSVSLVCLFVLSCFSRGFSASAELIADTYITHVDHRKYYFLGNNNVIEDIDYVAYPDTSGSSFTHTWDYIDAYGYDAIEMFFEFPESKYVLGQTYELKFDVSTNQNYIYSYFLPNAIPMSFTNEFFSVGDSFFPYLLNNSFLSSLSDTQKEGMQTSAFSKVTSVTIPISIPADYMSDVVSIAPNAQKVIPVYIYATFYSLETFPINRVTYSNIRLIPTGSTQYLYGDQQFQDDVIGSEDSGGLKGIFSELKKLPSRFGEWITSLGDRISGFFTDLKDGLLNGIKDLFIPTEDQINDFKDRTDQLLSDHLGVIYQAPNIMIDFIQELADFEPLRSDDKNDYYIEFPSKNIYLKSDADDSLNIISESDNGGEVIPLIPDNTGNSTYRWSFGWLNDKPFSTFYSVYNVVIIFITVIGFCSYCIRKYNNIMEG